MVAYRLVDLMGRAGAANILGITVRELDKLVDVFELSERFSGLRGPSGAALTWARELMGVSKKLMTPTIQEAVIEKVNKRQITNSKDVRKLRAILRDPTARANFMSSEGNIESALLRIEPPASEPKGLLSDLAALCDSIKGYSWTELEALRQSSQAREKVREAHALLQKLQSSLSGVSENE
jgi:ParB family chromosome partitioning protein